MLRHILLLFALLSQVSAFAQTIGADGTITFYYPNKSKQSKGKLINGKKEGIWTFYNVDGKVTGTETYANSQMNGRCLYYHVSNGMLWTEGDCKNHKREGLWKYYFANGKPSGSEVYIGGLMNGKAEYYDSLSNTRIAEGEHLNNKRDGTWRFYFMYTGKLKAIENYKENRLDGLSVYFDSTTGKKTNEGNYRQGKMNGAWKLHTDESGGAQVIQQYKDDVPDDNVIFQFDSLIMKGKLVDGDMHGEWTLYDTTGKLLSTIMFDKGVEVGGKTHDAETGLPATTVKVKRNGNKEERNQYSITNKLISARYYADEDLRKLVAYDTISGKITYEMELKNDQMHGDFRFYNKNGEVILVERYEHDEQNGITTEYDRDNDISATYTYKKGQKHGAFTMTAANKKWMEGNYANDSLDGSWLVYFPSGKLKRRLVFKNGQAISDSCFDEGGKQVKLSPFIRKAQFRGNVMTYIGDNLRYPAAAKEKGIEGRVLVRFTINESGHVSDVIAQKSVDHELDAEAVRLVSQMPPWQPEQVDAKKIKCRKTLPIVFWIPDTDKK